MNSQFFDISIKLYDIFKNMDLIKNMNNHYYIVLKNEIYGVTLLSIKNCSLLVNCNF